jgi:hypothetical protein
VCLDEITGKDLAGTDTTVVRTLGAGETSLGPAIWVSIGIEDGVLLLETEPGLSVGSSVHDLLAVSAVVGLVDSAIVVVTLAEDEDVGTSTERVLEDGNGALEMSARLRDDGHATGRWPVKLKPRDYQTLRWAANSRGTHQSCLRELGWLMIRQSSTP